MPTSDAMKSTQRVGEEEWELFDESLSNYVVSRVVVEEMMLGQNHGRCRCVFDGLSQSNSTR